MQVINRSWLRVPGAMSRFRLLKPFNKSVAKPARRLVLALLIGLLAGFTHLLEPVELAMQVARNNLNERAASGRVALVAIDDRSVAEIGAPPWNGSQLAALVERAHQAGAAHIHIDAELPSRRDERHMRRLEIALRSARGSVTLPARVSIDPVTQQQTEYLPPAQLAQHAALVNSNLRIGWDGTVRAHPYSSPPGGRPLPSMASLLSGRTGAEGELFPIDYSIDPRTVPTISGSDLLNGRVAPEALMGRQVVIGRTDLTVERFWAPGYGTLPAVMLQVLAAETLFVGRPVDLGWLLPVLIGSIIAALLLFSRSRLVAAASLFAAAAGAVVLPVLLDRWQIFVSPLPALLIVLIAVGFRWVSSLRKSYDVRGTTNLVTGLPNLQALRQVPGIDAAILVVARARNFAQITATLQPKHEKDLVEQIVSRLSFGTDGALIYQLDEGVFVWVSQDGREESVIQQIEALHALFRSPIVIDVRLIDLAMTFGLDLDSSRPLLQRLPSALVAADTAAREGKRWASFNPASLEDADWAMSLLGRLDHAIEADELWVAYQPKLDLRTGHVTGAEALVRWMHPEKGQIFPDQFIAAAEEGGRIEQLTQFVLDRALETAAAINGSGRRFEIAVNLSALLLTSDRLVNNVAQLLQKHRLAPHLLTLEVTETSTMGSAEDALGNLRRLANLGVSLSIDDYGTGFSTLDYLKRIPACELKIDRSFVSMLHKSQSDRIMVNSTIQLAHSLGRKVVAEGVENEDILTELIRMGCDLAQGYHIARPAPLPGLLEFLARPAARQAA
jgi:EAL domain-containing protein (putative c-di-GMP-specific phosphodiesterase class I)/CHASE2 domain-containing sensor protein